MLYKQNGRTYAEQLEERIAFYHDEGMQGKCAIPDYITDNIKHPLFDWQRKALENLITANIGDEKPNHLLFNMATGTGKTLLMAACILYYYKQGYRHFLFFVNQNNIVDKTENNFINQQHNKYLFKQKIVIDDKTVNIKKVDTFSPSPNGIEIKFTTVQKFYNDIHAEKENINTLDELNRLNLVMLADEAHHLNANTKNIKVQEDLYELTGSKNEREKLGWEHTILNLVLAQNPRHILLEFTATVPNEKEVQEKYKDKIIYKYDLKDFLRAGFTKEINLLALNAEKKERILTALVFSWYRYHVALKNKIPDFKSVTLFRSKTIADSKADFNDFIKIIQNLKGNDLTFLHLFLNKLTNDNATEKSVATLFIEKILTLINEGQTSFSIIADWIRNNFSEKNILITNSKINTKGKEKTDLDTEKLLNNLEDKTNPIRAIFTVDRLTEGWDVLNLFDIVRLYEGQNSGGNTKKIPETTTSEIQLIGRGIRYYPFDYRDKIRNKRKFDDDLNHELRALEELFFHAYDDDKARYISHLRQELVRQEYLESDKKLVTYKIKDNFRQKASGINLFSNRRIKNPNRRKLELNDFKKTFNFDYSFPSFSASETHINFSNENNISTYKSKGVHTNTFLLKDLPKQLFFKAIAIKAKSDNADFQFKNLKENLAINSVNELLEDQFLGTIRLDLTYDTNTFDDIPGSQKLNMMLNFVTKLFSELGKDIHPYKGSYDFTSEPLLKVFGQSKQKLVKETKEVPTNFNPEKEDWYILNEFTGNDLEEELVNFIKEQVSILDKKYNEVYLLRNEEVYKIYDFDQGRGFQPDFLLFLKDKESDLHYQVFIEPKGGHIEAGDQWKEDFLKQITEIYGEHKILQVENSDYRLVGLPFYTEDPLKRREFKDKFKSMLKLN